MPLVTKVLYNLEVIKWNQPDKYHIPGTKRLIYIVTYQIDTSNVVILLEIQS